MRNLYLLFWLCLSTSALFAQVTVPSGHSKIACGPSTFNLAATGADSGEIYKWYDATTSGNLLFADTATGINDTSFFNSGKLLSSDTFYVCIDSAGFISSFVPIIAKVNPLAVDIGQSYILNSLNNGMVAYYHFNGNAYDESGHGHNGVIYNAPFLPGVKGSAINFTGDQTSYVNTGNWNFPDTFSISVFFNLKDTSTGYNSRMILAKYDDPTINMFVDIKEQSSFYSARLGFKSKNNSQTYYISDTTKLYPKKWYNLIITYNGNNLVQMYINGKLKWEKSNITTQGVSTSSVPVTIGKAYSNPFATNDADFAGLLDELRVYNRVLNQQEIYEINDAGIIGVKLFTNTICKSQNDTITIFRSQPGISYQLFNNSTIYGSAQNGTGSILIFPLSNLMSSAIFQINATDIITGCSKMLDTLFHIQVNCCVADVTKNISIEEDTICTLDSTFFIISNPQAGIAYSVFKATDSSAIGKAQYSNLGSLRLSSGYISIPSSFLIYAEDTTSGCFRYADTILRIYTCLKLKTTSTSSSCGQHNGSATVQISGGTPPYRLLWSTGDTTLTADSLHSGIYSVQIWDFKGNTTSSSVNINDINGPQVLVDKIFQVSCKGKRDGAIQTTINGGSAPYKIEWSNGKTIDDINNLEAGPYEITVTDTNKCSTIITVIVPEPEALSVKINTTEAICKAADGSATALVSGGTKPYSYLWSNGDIDSFANGLKAGIFTVAITDVRGCKAVLPTNVAVHNTGGPVIRFDSMQYADIGALNGALFITYSGGTKPYDTILWSNGRKNEDINWVAAGIYDLTIVDHKGCKGTFSGQVLNKPVNTPEICIVTVDSASGRNLVVWKKPASTVIKYYNIYRETSIANTYTRVDSIKYDSLSKFLDPVANPFDRSWRYKISAVDKIGRETILSPEHKTIHLRVNVGVGNTFNLTWDHYNGFAISKYYIYRYLQAEGWIVLDSLASTLSSYTDAPDTLYGLKYFIAIKKPDGSCIGPYSQSVSNVKDYSKIYIKPISINDVLINPDVKIYPNPTNDFLNIVTIRKDIEKTLVFDVLGNMIIETRFSSILDMSKLAKGFYIIKLTGNKNKIIDIERVIKK